MASSTSLSSIHRFFLENNPKAWTLRNFRKFHIDSGETKDSAKDTYLAHLKHISTLKPQPNITKLHISRAKEQLRSFSRPKQSMNTSAAQESGSSSYTISNVNISNTSASVINIGPALEGLAPRLNSGRSGNTGGNQSATVALQDVRISLLLHYLSGRSSQACAFEIDSGEPKESAEDTYFANLKHISTLKVPNIQRKHITRAKEQLRSFSRSTNSVCIRQTEWKGRKNTENDAG